MTTATAEPVDIYARRSAKGDKTQRSVSGQVQVCKSILAKRDLPLGQVHVDDGRSAWNPKVERPGWDTLMARLESGESGGVIVFDMERFSRRPIEGERLIAAAERGLVVLDSDGEFDLATASGKKSFRDAMDAAAYDSDRLSDRVTRGKKQKALAGEPNGCRPFGFLADGVTPHPEESKILREVAGRLLAGESQESLVRELNDRKIPTVRGKLWTRPGLRTALTRPRNAGLVTYRGTVVAKLDGETVLTGDEHERLLSLYAARRPGRPPSGAYLCSGAVVCGACGKPLSGRPRYDRRYPDGEARREYFCSPTGGYGGCGKIAIDQRGLDAHAAELAIVILSDAVIAHAAELAAAEAEAEAVKLDAEIAKAEELRRQLADRLGRGELELDVFDAAVAPLDKRLARLREQRNVLDPGPVRIPADSEAAWRRRWVGADPQERRSLLRLALRGRKLVVAPADPADRSVARRVTVELGSGSGSAAGVDAAGDQRCPSGLSRGERRQLGGLAARPLPGRAVRDDRIGIGHRRQRRGNLPRPGIKGDGLAGKWRRARHERCDPIADRVSWRLGIQPGHASSEATSGVPGKLKRSRALVRIYSPACRFPISRFIDIRR